MDKQMSINYNPRSAWLRATIYFATCFVIAYGSGALQKVLDAPLATTENLRNMQWILFTLLCIGVEVWAYVFLWPRGTLTHGRRLYWSVVLTFGVFWGLSEGLLFLSVYILASKFIASRFLVWLVSFLVIGTFIGL
jgi:glucan phosphoethanolaminetransferase (alkaline phosphatase superfamily)